jgi:flagellar basal body-associated protein FliL
LRLEVSVEGPPGQAAIIESKQAQLRDSIIAAVSDYTWNELEGAAGKTRLRDELYARANGVVAPASVDRIYFTQFVVQ